jgi:hypothetical protein
MNINNIQTHYYIQGRNTVERWRLDYTRLAPLLPPRIERVADWEFMSVLILDFPIYNTFDLKGLIAWFKVYVMYALIVEPDEKKLPFVS